MNNLASLSFEHQLCKSSRGLNFIKVDLTKARTSRRDALD